MEVMAPCLGRSGQSTIEFAVAFPTLIVVAVIAVNGLLFLGDCAAFDRGFRQEVCVVAASPGYEQTISASCGQIESCLQSAFDRDYLSCEVMAFGTAEGCVTFEGTLDFSPTLFGLGLKQEVFGVRLPHLRHSVRMAVDVYKPGVLL